MAWHCCPFSACTKGKHTTLGDSCAAWHARLKQLSKRRASKALPLRTCCLYNWVRHLFPLLAGASSARSISHLHPLTQLVWCASQGVEVPSSAHSDACSPSAARLPAAVKMCETAGHRWSSMALDLKPGKFFVLIKHNSVERDSG